MGLEAIKGADQILLFRLKGETNPATKLAFQTEHSIEASVDGGDSTATKDGSLSSPGTPVEEWPFTSIAARGDETREMLWKAFREQKVVEVWQIDKGAEEQEGKYPARYAQGLIQDLSETANVEDLMELSGTIKINGVPKEGKATLTEDQKIVVQYLFVDTTAVAEDEVVG